MSAMGSRRYPSRQTVKQDLALDVNDRAHGRRYAPPIVHAARCAGCGDLATNGRYCSYCRPAAEELA